MKRAERGTYNNRHFDFKQAAELFDAKVIVLK
jgi:hypothetical protein